MTIPELECCLCASIMDEPTAKLSPIVCTALSYAPDMWESPEAAKVAQGIKKCIEKGRPVHRIPVGLFMGYYNEWLKHPTFTQGLPLSCLDEAIRPLLEYYRTKRIIQILGNAYTKAQQDQSNVRQIAAQLKEELEGVLCK